MASKTRRIHKPDTSLRGVLPNAGIAASYRKQLDALIKEMHESVLYWVADVYKAQMAQDDTPADSLQRMMNRLGAEWLKRFNVGAKRMADWFAESTRDYSDRQFKQILKDAGFSVEFRMTPTMQDAYSAVIHEQVGLIRSIPEKYLTDVQGLVMRSVQSGRDLHQLTKDLQSRYRITRRRAELIARDQNNKATAVLQRTRQLEVGITKAIWRHSTAGKHQRPTHVQMDDKPYDIEQGMWDSAVGQYVWPGTEINCRCYCRPVLPINQG